MNTIAISHARTQLPSLVENVSQGLERIWVTVNSVPKAVLISAEELIALEETAEVMSIPGARGSIERGLKQAQRGEGVSFSELRT